MAFAGLPGAARRVQARRSSAAEDPAPARRRPDVSGLNAAGNIRRARRMGRAAPETSPPKETPERSLAHPLAPRRAVA